MRGLGVTGALLVASLGVAAIILVRVIIPSGTMGWDEGYHALWGARILADLRQGDALAFAYDSYRQVYWPPLHSWWMAFWFAIAGETTVVARASSLPA
ncbi:MAG: hypothetical protein NZ518_10335, partial [Dehalococcoidia bacterium]|nr:hypothetical protein [Dehalococcoidia bacterium]